MTTADENGGTITNPFNEEFAQFAKDQLQQWNVPGVSVAVIDNDQVFAQGYGLASLPDNAATPETVWYGGSTTKAFTGAILSHFINEKMYPEKLSKGWSTTISSIIRDDFVLQDEWMTSHLTLEDAVCHRTGMPRHDMACRREDNDGNKLTLKDIVRNFRNLQITGEPRTKFAYCNNMYVVLSHVIETLTGKELGEVFKEYIWEPLGMKSTYLDLNGARDSGALAQGHHWDKLNSKFIPLEDMETHDISGAGGILSTVLDYTKWLKCLLREEAPFSKETHKDIRTPRIMGAMPAGGKDINMYGVGWERTLYNGHEMLSHSGGTHAFGAQVCWFPQHQYGVVAIGNTLLTANAVDDTLCYRLIDDRLHVAERHVVGAQWRSIVEMSAKGRGNALDTLYPHRPSPKLAPSLETRHFAGTYEDPGYGSFTLREEPHPTETGETILVAERPETTWRYVMKLHHATGDYWVIYFELQGMLDAVANSSAKCQFQIGADGQVSSLEIHWDLGGGVVSFKQKTP